MSVAGFYFGGQTNTQASCRCCSSPKARDASPTCEACASCRYAGIWHRGDGCPVRGRAKRTAARANATRAARRKGA